MGIYNYENQLTAEGRKVKETGLVKETEEGKYQIWYTQNDVLFNNRVFYFRRIKPETGKNPQINPLELNFGHDVYCQLPIQGKDGKGSIEFSIVGQDKYRGETAKDAVLDCTWTWNDTDSSSFVFSGKLETANTDKNSKPWIDSLDAHKSVNFKIDLKNHIPSIIPNWNDETGRCKIKLEQIENEDTYLYFEYSGVRPREGYYSCAFEQMPVEPYNTEEALVWRNCLLKTEIEKQYIHPDDFDGIVNNINEKKGFAAYSGQMDSPGIKEYIDKLEPAKKSERGKAYWHIAAPLDINVAIPQSLHIDSFSYKDGDSVSFAKIAEKMKEHFTTERVYYYDRYVISDYQQRKASVFLKCFGAADICVITDKTKQGFNDYLAKHEPRIIVENTGNIYQNRKDAPHDRYIVLRRGGELLVWTSTNSIDYIQFDRSISDIQAETQGKIKTSVTFTKVKDDVLETQLKNYILKG
jgi:hypothetical protein